MRAVLTNLIHILFVPMFWVLCVLVLLTALGYLRKGHPVWREKRRLLAGASLATYLVSAPALPNALINLLEAEYPLPSDAQLTALGPNPTIVVLTGGVFHATPTGFEIRLATDSWQRMATGVHLWKRIGGRLIFTGAPVPDHTDSNAEELARVARELGVPANRIGVETRSTNTYENLEYTQRKFGLTAADHIVLVSSALNLPRAMAVAHNLRLPMLAYPCDYRGEQHQHWLLWVPRNAAAVDLEDLLHELLGCVGYRVRGWI